MTTVTTNIAAQHGDQPRVAYCALCETHCLYVQPCQRGYKHAQPGTNGEILNRWPDPKGRWIDRGDGYYTELSHPPSDATGRRAHRCT
jgi:hypothetical protein